MSEWAPVVAALGTGAFGFGGVAWQQHRREKAGTEAERAKCYYSLIAHSLSFAMRAQTLRSLMQARSGVASRLDVKMTIRDEHPEIQLGSDPGIDPLVLHDWLNRSYEPINQAWATVEVVGSDKAIEIATQLIDACADTLRIATRAGTKRGKATSFVIGLRWTDAETRELDDGVQRIMRGRRALIRLAREESGLESIASQ